jgi:hypothetical protein
VSPGSHRDPRALLGALEGDPARAGAGEHARNTAIFLPWHIACEHRRVLTEEVR